MGGVKITDGTEELHIDSDNQALVTTNIDPLKSGSISIFSENDAGDVSGTRTLLSPETDGDFRLRIAEENILDDETFNYTAQNTGKHQNLSTTMTFVYGTGGLLTNGTSITTTTTAVSLQSYAFFPFFSAGENLYIQADVSFSAQPVANTIVDFGSFLRGAANPYAPTDGAYFRLNSSGLQGVVNSNGSETTVSLSSFTYTNSTVYKFLIIVTNNYAQFWIDDVLYGTINTPIAQGQPFMSAALPFGFRHTITGGAAGGVFQATLRGYSVSIGGVNLARTLGETGNSVFGSYQGLSGSTMGSLATYPNSTNPTAAAPSNTALTANLPAGLGGQGAVTAAVAAATDGIWGSYQVPAGTVSIAGKRLKITGVYIDAVNNGAAVATTATTIQFSLGFGNTTVSLATVEGAPSKTSRRVPLGFMTWAVAAPVGAGPQGGSITRSFTEPIYVNPGEFIQLIGKFLIGTATGSQVINFVWQPIYSWE